MNPFLKKLQQISNKNERRVIGLMSGTSMDGLDIALCRFSGSGRETSFELEQFTSMPYEETDKQQLMALVRSPNTESETICVWHTRVAHIHGDMVNRALEDWGLVPDDIDLLASHGQTFHHAPRHKHQLEGMPDATMQIGDGDHLAHRTGMVVISDFRQRDVARGNEGAPLAAYGDYLLFNDDRSNRILLNIGGIGNITWLPAGTNSFPPYGTDTGPGNTLIDAATAEYFGGMYYDKDGGLAARGEVHEGLLACLKEHPFFRESSPKTTGFEVFHLTWVHDCIVKSGFDLQPEDLLATLTRFTSDTICDEIWKVIPDGADTEVYVSGGGAYNDTMMKQIESNLSPVPVQTTEKLGIGVDAKEAVLFAVFANEMVCGEDTRLHLGKISFPD